MQHWHGGAQQGWQYTLATGFKDNLPGWHNMTAVQACTRSEGKAQARLMVNLMMME
jgi:hypothetical protein